MHSKHLNSSKSEKCLVLFEINLTIMKDFLLIVTIAAFTISCGGGESHDGASHKAENPAVEAASTQDLDVLHETENLEQKAEEASAKADSILNSL